MNPGLVSVLEHPSNTSLMSLPYHHRQHNTWCLGGGIAVDSQYYEIEKIVNLQPASLPGCRDRTPMAALCNWRGPPWTDSSWTMVLRMERLVQNIKARGGPKQANCDPGVGHAAI